MAPVSPDAKLKGTPKPSNATQPKPNSRNTENITPRGNANNQYRSRGHYTGGTPNNRAVNSWLNGTENNKPTISAMAPEFKIKARKGQDVNAMINQFRVSGQNDAAQKSKPHVFNPRADDPVSQRALESLASKKHMHEEPARYDGWGQLITGPPEAPDPRWKTGRPPSPSVIEAFSKARNENEGGVKSSSSSSSKSKRRGMALGKERSSDNINLD